MYSWQLKKAYNLKQILIVVWSNGKSCSYKIVSVTGMYGILSQSITWHLYVHSISISSKKADWLGLTDHAASAWQTECPWYVSHGEEGGSEIVWNVNQLFEIPQDKP